MRAATASRRRGSSSSGRRPLDPPRRSPRPGRERASACRLPVVAVKQRYQHFRRRARASRPPPRGQRRTEMRIGIIPRYVTPNLTDPGWLGEWAAAVESAGVESVWTVEHVAVPAVIESEYPYTPDGKIRFSADVPFPDPLDSLAFVAGLT